MGYPYFFGNWGQFWELGAILGTGGRSHGITGLFGVGVWAVAGAAAAAVQGRGAIDAAAVAARGGGAGESLGVSAPIAAGGGDCDRAASPAASVTHGEASRGDFTHTDGG